MITLIAAGASVTIDIPELLNPGGPEFYVLLAMLVFLAIVWRVGAFGQITKNLDARAAKIRKDLESAAELKAEAENLLATFADRQAEAEKEAARILEDARREAERIRSESARALEAEIRRKTAQAEQRIAQAEAAAERNVRERAVDLAIATARTAFAERPGALDGMLEQAIEKFPDRWQRQD